MSTILIIIIMATTDLSVCPCVKFRCLVQTNEDTIVQSLVSGRIIILVSGEVKLIRIFVGGHPQQGR